MMASSAAWSTSETKSFWRLLRTVSFSRSKEARLMMLPALRAAFTAVLSMGCMEGALGSRAAAGLARRDAAILRGIAAQSRMDELPLRERIAVVLSRPSHPGNIGGA